MLDVGCGTGRVTEAAAGARPTGPRVGDGRVGGHGRTRARRGSAIAPEVWRQDVARSRTRRRQSTWSSRRRRCIGSPTMIAFGRDWLRRFGRAVCSRSSAGDEGNIDRVRKVIDEVARASRVRSSSAGRPGCSLRLQADRTAGCTRSRIHRRSGAGWRSARPIRRTWPRSCPRRSSRHTSRGSLNEQRGPFAAAVVAGGETSTRLRAAQHLRRSRTVLGERPPRSQCVH